MPSSGWDQTQFHGCYCYGELTRQAVNRSIPVTAAVALVCPHPNQQRLQCDFQCHTTCCENSRSRPPIRLRLLSYLAGLNVSRIAPTRLPQSCITKRSKIDASSFSGLFTRVEIGHIVMGSAG